MSPLKSVRLAIASVFVLTAGCDGEPSSVAFDSGSPDVQTATRDVFDDAPLGPVPDAGADVPLTPPPVTTWCMSDHETPLPAGLMGMTTCVPVGASIADVADEWPDYSLARHPLVFVRSDVTVTGDGTIDRPYQTIGEAVNALQTTLGNGTVVLHRGDHMLATTVIVRSDIAFLGVSGPTGTAIAPPSSGAAATIETAGVSFTITGVTFNKAATHHAQSMLETGLGTLVLNDVSILAADTGIDATHGHLRAQALTIVGTTTGIELSALGDGSVRSLLIRDASVGIRSTGGSLDLAQALIAHPTQAGLSVSVGSASPRMTLDRVAVLESGLVGIWLGGAGLHATATHIVVGDTAFTGPGTGTGLLVTDGAGLMLDETAHGVDQRGAASIFRGNGGTGIVFANQAHGLVRGAFVASNHQSGIVLQTSANVEEIGDCWIAENFGTGLTVTARATLTGLLCDGFRGNLQGVIQFSGGQQMQMAAGADIEPDGDSSTVMPLQMTGCLFFGNQGFGLVSRGVEFTTPIESNSFNSNDYGWATFDAPANATGSGQRTYSETNPPPNGMPMLPGQLVVGSAP